MAISAEVLVSLALAVFFTVLSRDDINDRVVWDFMSAIGWFASGVVWLIGGTPQIDYPYGIIAYFFMGLGILMIVLGIMDSIELMGFLATRREQE